MFPLGTVLMPGSVLPLHIFEPRYRALVRDCLDAPHPDFGVVLIERGSEVGGGDTRSMVGTVARIVEVVETEDGRYALLAMGHRRIRVVRWLDDDPYPLAEVTGFDDETAATTDEVDQRYPQLVQRVRRLLALALELGDPVADPAQPIDDDPSRGSFRLAAIAPVTDFDRQQLLTLTSPAERLRLLADMLDTAEAILQFRLSDLDEG